MFLLPLLLAAAPPQTPLPSEVSALVRETMRAFSVPGAAVVVVKNDRILYLAGHGVREAGKLAPVTADTIFPLSSNTKAFTSAVIATLVAEGKLAFDDPVRKYLPDFRLGDDDALSKRVTLRDVLTHRTGLAPHLAVGYRVPWSIREAVTRAGTLPLSADFRAKVQYQNVMFAAAGFAAAEAAGEPWDVLVRRRLLTPLGMTRTTLTVPDSLRFADVAMPHRLDAAGKAALVGRYKPAGLDPSTGASSCAKDVATWLRFQLRRGEWGGKQIVPAKLLDETRSGQIDLGVNESQRELFPETLSIRYSMGWVRQQDRRHLLVSHGGAVDGYRTHLLLLPGHDIGVAVLCNLDGTAFPWCLSQLLMDRLLAEPPADWVSRHRRVRAALKDAYDAAEAKRRKAFDPAVEPAVGSAAYAGTYTHPAYGDVVVKESDGALSLTRYGERSPLTHLGAEGFAFDLLSLGRGEATFEIRGGKAVAVTAAGVRYGRK